MRLEIERLSLDCVVGGDHPDPTGARDRVVALSRHLPPRLEQQVRPLCGGEEIILVRSLELDVAVDLDAPIGASLDRWSRAFATTLARQLSASGQGVVRFANGAEQLACFVRDLVGGDAWSLWYHRPFAGLRALPTGQALATALAADPVRGQHALARLDEITIARAGELMGPEVEPLADSLCRGVADDEGSVDLLTLCEAALRHDPAPGPRLLAVLKARAAMTGRPCGPRDLTLCRTVVAALAPDPPEPAPHLRDREERPGRASRERPRTPPGNSLAADIRACAAQARIRRIGTAFGGPLLLLRDLDRVPLDPDLPGPGDLTGADAIRALVLAALSGPGRGRDFLLDPLWRDLLAIPSDTSVRHLLDWADRAMAGISRPAPPGTRRAPPWPSGLDLSPVADGAIGAIAGLVLDGFARRLPGFSESSASHLYRNFLDVRATVLGQDDHGLTAIVSRPPLDPILALSGAADWTAEIAWTRPSRIAVAREPR